MVIAQVISSMNYSVFYYIEGHLYGTNLHFVLKHTKYDTCELTVSVTQRSQSPQCLRRIEGGRLASRARDEVERSRKMQ